MPHYADGATAKIGDRVIGKGYNVKRTISGIVVGVIEGSESCNLRVAHLRPASVQKPAENDKYAQSKPTGHTIEWNNNGVFLGIDSVPLLLEMEYGDTKGFNKVPD